MSGGARPIHAGRGEGDSLRNPVATGGPLEIRARGEETGGALTACESVTMPGEGPPFHKHANEDEAMYFVDGAFRLRIEDEVIDMAPGSFAFVPRDRPHSWQNVSEGQAHMLFVFTPASPKMERFFERFAELGEEGVAVLFAFSSSPSPYICRHARQRDLGDRPAPRFLPPKVGTKVPPLRQNPANPRGRSCIAATLATRSKMNRAPPRGHRL